MGCGPGSAPPCSPGRYNLSSTSWTCCSASTRSASARAPRTPSAWRRCGRRPGSPTSPPTTTAPRSPRTSPCPRRPSTSPGRPVPTWTEHRRRRDRPHPPGMGHWERRGVVTSLSPRCLSAWYFNRVVLCGDTAVPVALSAWPAHAPGMGFSWGVPGIFLGCSWDALGMFPRCSWDIPGFLQDDTPQLQAPGRSPAVLGMLQAGPIPWGLV